MVGELNQEQIWNLLASEVVGRIGCCHDNQVYVVPVTYASDRETAVASLKQKTAEGQYITPLWSM